MTPPLSVTEKGKNYASKALVVRENGGIKFYETMW